MMVDVTTRSSRPSERFQLDRQIHSRLFGVDCEELPEHDWKPRPHSVVVQCPRCYSFSYPGPDGGVPSTDWACAPQVPLYSSNLADAMALLPEMAKRGYDSVLCEGLGDELKSVTFTAGMSSDDELPAAGGTAETLAEAIARAVLWAVLTDDEREEQVR
jgi:hypothetical protein